MSEIRDRTLAPAGHKKIAWAMAHMPVLAGIRKDFEAQQPFAGMNISLSVHLEAKTACLCLALAAGGAKMSVTGSNPLSTQDEIAAALAELGLNVNAWHGATPEEYARHIRLTAENGPHIVIDDGGDLVNCLHNELPQLCDGVIGGCEETTTGVIRLVAMAKDGALRFPMILANNAKCKHMFDNRYGTGQSVWDAIDHTTNLLVAGKAVVVAGYGWCGKGIAMRAKGLGARVIVTEVDPVTALEAVMDSFEVMPMDQAAPLGDVFVTATSCRDVIVERHFATMKDGAILTNAGHFNVEVDVATLKRIAIESVEQRPNIMGYRMADGRWLSLIGDGRLVNLTAGNGHPAEIMDLSFSVQALSALYLVQNRPSDKIIPVPAEIDDAVAQRKLQQLGRSIDTLSPEQRAYMESWNL